MNYANQTEEMPRNRLNTNGLNAARQPQVQSALSSLEKQIEELNDTMGNLEERLSSCTRASVPEPCQGQDQKEPELGVPLAKRIDEAYKQVQAITRRAMRITQAIEL